MRASFLSLLAGCILSMTAAENPPLQLNPDEQLQAMVEQAAAKTVEEFASSNLKPEELAITVVDLRDPDRLRSGSHRGGALIYPASVIKLFYLEAAHRWMEERKLADSKELRRAMSDMIVLSHNEATHYIVDLLTGTTSGPELPEDQMAEWGHKRNAVNRYFADRGYTGINVNQKPWCEGPYGRERAWVGQSYTNRNMLTTDATARLLSTIVLGRAVSAARSQQMLDLMKRDPFSPAKDPDDQSHGFTGPAVPRGAKLWSKAGWTSQTRHDAAVIELRDGKKFVLVTFTENHSNERGIIPAVAEKVIEFFGRE